MTSTDTQGISDEQIAEQAAPTEPKVIAALRELLDSWMAEFPSYEQGREAQEAWADRRAKAREDAAAILAAHPHEAAPTEPVDEYDRLKAQKDRLLQREREKHCKCDECGKAKSAGWALYCVECSGKFYATPSQPVGTLTDERIEFGLNCNLEDPSDDESNGFYAGVKFAEHAHGILAAMGTPAAAEPGKGEGK